MSCARRSLQITAFIATLIVGVASMAVIVTQTTWFKEWLRGFIVRQSEDYVNGRLSIGRLDGNLFFGVELEDVDVTVNGKKVVDIKDVGLDYNVLTFMRGHVVLDDIRLNRPVIRLVKTAEGWNIAHLIKARTPDPDEPKRTRLPLEIGEIGVTDGELHFESQPVGTSGVDVPERIDKLNASIGLSTDEDALTVKIAHVSLRAHEPSIGINDLSGRIVRTENTVTLDNVALRTEESSLRVAGTIQNIEGSAQAVDIKASSDKLALNELANVLPALRGMALQPAFELTAKGPADAMAVNFNAREKTVGKAIGDLKVDATGPGRRVAGTVTMEHLNAGPIATRNAAEAFRQTGSKTFTTDVTGTARIDLALPSGRMPLSGTYTLNASRAAAWGYKASDVKAKGRIDGRTITVDATAAGYGGRATATGVINAVTPVTLQLRGRAAHVDMRNLPPQLKMPGVPSDLQFAYTLNGRGRVVSADVTMDASTLAGAAIADGTTGSVTLGDGAPQYASEGSVQNLDIQQIGRGFAIGAIATDRFRSKVTATFNVKGSGGGRHPLELDASGVMTDSEVFGATVPRMEVKTHFSGADAQVRAIGQFAGLNPAVPFNNEKIAGDVTGAVDVDTTLRNYRQGVTVDSIDASGRINLGTSTIAGFAVDSAVVDGTYANRVGEMTQLTIAGPDGTLQGQGTLALNETGSSNMTVHADTPSLDRVGEMLGQPLKGAAIVDATLTGNARELKAAGTLKGSNVGHGSNEALTLASTFTVSVPDLTPAQATIDAKSQATFLEIAGQRVTELTADTKFAGQRLEFNATAKEGVRQLGAAGSAVFHPDHREIHLGNISLKAENSQWTSEPGSEATIQYGKDRLALHNVRLVSGDQRVAADGVVGSASEPLEVRAENVDIAQLDELLMRNPGMAGRLTAAATVTGKTDALRGRGTFSLAQGAFRQFKFESLAGDVEYTGSGANVDVRLQQRPQAWLTAKGFAPLSLFRGTREEERGRPEAPADLRIETSQIDLGVIQGFTSYVTNVTGTLQANVHVEGTGLDPHATGFIDVRNGTFALPDLGTAYTGFDTRIDLKPDLLSISEMRIVDEHRKVMTVGGTLATHDRAVGAVDITIKSEDFEVIDNRLADLKLDTDLRLTGELREPRIEGFVEVESGSVNVAEILDQTTSDPYATEATELGPTLKPEGPEAPARVSLFDALEVDMGLAVPSNLVLKGTNLRPANAVIDIGDMIVTVGGAVQVRKPRGGQPRITGEVNTVRGSYTFQGRRFEIMRDGRIRFAGTEEIDPTIDLRARRVISGVETFVRVRGTMRQPELSFSSNPPLEEADILALIVFNMPVNELGEGQQISLAERAGALAGGYFASGLARSIGDALELDEFEIGAQGESGSGPSLTIGEQVGERLFFRIRQGFGEAQATEFILEYQLRDYLRVQGSIAETAGGAQRTMFRRIERGGLDLIFFFSY